MSPSRREQGFSLIEVLVVMVIIGIATAAISVNISPRPADRLRLEARELAQRLDAAQYEVRLDGRVIVWQPQGEGYAFARGNWVDVPGQLTPALSTAGELDTFPRDEVLRPRRWRDGPVDITPAAPLRLTSEWIGSPFVLTLKRGNDSVAIVRDATGSFKVP